MSSNAAFTATKAAARHIWHSGDDANAVRVGGGGRTLEIEGCPGSYDLIMFALPYPGTIYRLDSETLAILFTFVVKYQR